MNIYIAHSSKLDYKNDLYAPIRKSHLNQKHSFTLTHELSDKPFDSKSFIKDRADLAIAEVSYPSTGLGIELGWANVFNIPILCIHKKTSTPSRSLRIVASAIIGYETHEDMIREIENYINNMEM